MKLIINGDDFGLTRGVSEGIIKTIKKGVLRDTSVMVNMPFFEEAIKLANENGIYEMGIHFTLTCGKPVLPISEVDKIVDKDGMFFKKPELMYIEMNQIEKELRAQLDKFLNSGMKLNHIDGHHHFYVFYPEVFTLVRTLAKEYNVPIRCPENEYIKVVKNDGINCPDYFLSGFYEEKISEEYLIDALLNLKDKYEVVEIMSHPAIVDDELMKKSSYNRKREEEVKVLTSHKVKRFIDDNNIELISFSEV